MSLIQSAHGHIPVDAATVVFAHTSVRIDEQFLVTIAHALSNSERVGKRRDAAGPGNEFPVGISELDPPLGVFRAGEVTLMHEPVMMATKLHQIGKTGLTTLAPVLDMVPVNVMFQRTGRKLAALIPGF